MAAVVQKVELNNGRLMPILGLGSFDGFVHTPEDLASMKNSVSQALKIGYRLIDCADVYANEHVIGEAIHEFLAATPSVTREDLFLTSKAHVFDINPEGIRAAVQRSLDRLKTSYLDLYLIHWPASLKKTEAGNVPTGIPLIEAWRALEQLVDEGKIRSIGVSNYGSNLLRELLAQARIKPTVNQVECNPYFSQSKLLRFCRENKIQLEAYSPLGKANSSYNVKFNLLEDPELVRIAQKHSTTPAAVALKWQIQRGVVVIPKSVNVERLKGNFFIGDVHLSQEDCSAIDALHRGLRLVNPPYANFDPEDD